MWTNLLSWLDASPMRFSIVAWVAFASAVAAGAGMYLQPGVRRWWKHPALFAALSLFSIIAFRWPMIMDNRELQDPDESQMMSGASKLVQDPYYWKSVDGDTRGPVNDLPLLAIAGIFGRIDYTGVRLLSGLLAWVCVLCAWIAFSHLFGSALARLLVLPLLAVHAFSDFWNFVQCSTEHMTDALVAVASVLLLTAWGSQKRLPSVARLSLAGFALGLAPFAKLQGAPIAVWIAVFVGAQILTSRDLTQKLKVRSLAAFLGGILAVYALVVLWVARGGAWGEFYESYILENLRYAGARWFSWKDTPAKLYELCAMAPGSQPFLVWAGALSLFGLLALPTFRPAHRRAAGFAVGMVIAAAFSTMAPGRMFPHYLQLIFFPMGLLSGIVVGAALSATRRSAPFPLVLQNTVPAAIVACFLVLGLVPQVVWRSQEAQPSLGRFRETHGALNRTAVATAVLRYARAGESMGIWGWGPKYWVETGLVQATRDGETSRQTDLSLSRNRYRARFMADLQESKPPVFIDAAGAGNSKAPIREESGYETFGELFDYVRLHYHQVAEIEGARIFVRNDRLSASISKSVMVP